MLQHIIEKISRKSAQGIILIFVVTILVFLLIQLMPGDPISLVSDRIAVMYLGKLVEYGDTFVFKI